ncbi:MAG: glycosyltransferase family 2 protein [Rhodocyclales bacterium]|nr:glycosyltransferase family 2 protein [Rhodocyclales bacterium]
MDITVECLKSLFASVSGDFELLLIDDASPDGMLPLFREAAEFHPNTRIYHFPENLEYTQSVNCLLSEATGERILFVSNDIFVTPTYLAALLEATADPDIGIARGVSNFVDNLLETHNVTPDAPIATWEQLCEFSARQYFEAGTSLPDDPFLIGDAFMVTRKLLDTIGSFDTRYHGYLSDLDFGIRAAAAGYRRIYCPRAFARHIQDANFHYLDSARMEQKYARRLERHATAWTVFRALWGAEQLPLSWPGTKAIPFADLEETARRNGARVVAPGSYARYLIAS